MSMNHPVQIATKKNETMGGCYDLAVFVGNFKDKREAEEYGKRIAEFLEKHAGAVFNPVQ